MLSAADKPNWVFKVPFARSVDPKVCTWPPQQIPNRATDTIIVTRTDNGVLRGERVWFYVFGRQGTYKHIHAIRAVLESADR